MQKAGKAERADALPSNAVSDESGSCAVAPIGVEPIEIDIVTGFLGAGKTTFINKLLSEGYGGPETALLENEFGDVAIDSDLIADNSVSVRTMATGCICCTLRGDFVTNLVDIVEQYRPRRIIVEPTGLANLADILDLCREAAKAFPLQVNAVITVASAENLMPLIMVGGDFFVDQLEQARFFLVSCSQLVDEEDLAETLECLEEHAGDGVPIMCGNWDDMSAVEIMAAAEQAWADCARGVAGDDEVAHEHEHEHEHEHVHEHEHKHGHSHSAHHHDVAGGCTSLAFSPGRVFSDDGLQALTELIAGQSAGTVLRAKGFLATAAGAVLYEYVYGKARWNPSRYRGPSKFVVIGRSLDERSFSKFLETD